MISALSCSAAKLAFLGYPLMRLGGIINFVLEVIAFGWQELRNRIGVADVTSAIGPRPISHCLTDFVFVSAHRRSP